MQILLTIGYSALFIFLIGKLRFYRLPGISSPIMISGFVITLFAGNSVVLIYTYYYTDRLTADNFGFFNDSAILFNALKTNPVDYLRKLNNLSNLLINAPNGFVTSLTRLFITDAGARLNTISAIENTGILIFGCSSSNQKLYC